MSDSRLLTSSYDPNWRGDIRSWLESWGFVGNPFASWEAGREPWLSRYFIRRPFFEQLLTNPKSALIFAPRGGGKTATRLMVETECRPELPFSPVFSVSFTDFSPFIETTSQHFSFTLGEYIPHLIGAALPRLLVAIGRQQSMPVTSPRLNRELRYWLEHYAPHLQTATSFGQIFRQIEPSLDLTQLTDVIRYIQERNSQRRLINVSGQVIHFADWIRKLVNATSASPQAPLDSPSRIIQNFIHTSLESLNVESAPCNIFYLLVDGIDEFELTHDNPHASAALLRPLIGNLHFLELPYLAVKFFLPIEQRAVFEAIARLDRLDIVELRWESTVEGSELLPLQRLLRRRIAAFNKQGFVSLAEMCVPPLRRVIEDAMIEMAQDSPRNLMRLGNMLINEHCRDVTGTGSLITLDDWERTRQCYLGLTEEVSETSNIRLENKMGTAELPPSIAIDLSAGRVFLGSQELRHLSSLEFRLLAFLYSRKGQICSKDEIANEVYGSPDVTDAMISRLIYRLRRRLESVGSQQSTSLQTVKGRGYLLDYTD